jgi:hypothetical protein
MDFYTLKWGDKYGAGYVNRLYGSLQKHYKKPFTFTCYTDNYNMLREEVKVKNIESLRKFNTDRVFTYEKLILMEKHEKGVWLDLDLLIHGDIDFIDDSDFKMIWNYWHPYHRSYQWYGKGGSCHVNSSFVKFDNPEWLIKFTNDNWEKIEWTYKSLDKYLFYQHHRNERLKFWDQGIITNYNKGGFKLKGKVSIFNTSHKYNNKGIVEESYELHDADPETVKLWKSYEH